VNNPDFSKSDIRIMDNNGEPNFVGRVEFRVGGKWGTVGNEGTTKAFARQVCRVLNYKDGEVLNTKKDFCTDFRGKDWCGLDAQPVHYTHYECAETDDTLDQCTRQVPGSFSHEGDVIIECSDADMKNEDDIKPEEGSVRLVGPSDSPSTEKHGRVEVYMDDRWGAVCNKGWNNVAAKISCKLMGYVDGKIIGAPGEFKSCQYKGDNYCVKSSKDYVLSELSCKETSKHLTECGATDKLDCSEEMTAMMECTGNGDNSGHSQKIDKTSNTKKPILGQLPLANPYFINCETVPDEFLFSGDPGSIYVGFCEDGCKDDSALVYGDGIYDENSSICKAAIHAGVLDNRGGFVTVKIGYSHKTFGESVSRNIGSIKKSWAKRSFTLSKTIGFHKKLSLE